MITTFHCHNTGKKMKVRGPRDIIIKKFHSCPCCNGNGNHLQKVPNHRKNNHRRFRK